MSDCGVCIGGEADGCYDLYHLETPKARKEHRCCECRRAISMGEIYARERVKFDGDIFTVKTCVWCREIRDAFACDNAITFGSLWSEIYENVFLEMTLGCFERLESASAKAFLQAKWIEWKFNPRNVARRRVHVEAVVRKAKGQVAA